MSVADGKEKFFSAWPSVMLYKHGLNSVLYGVD
jgi:hypothetical protein